ncbi:SDR family oxidoreductase [Actinomycetes bacterium KLBMP 9759]
MSAAAPAGRTAVVYGGSGAIGRSVGRALARDGAQVYLAGLRRERLDSAAAHVGAAGADVVDVLDEAAVERHAASVVDRAGRIDVCVNAVGFAIGQQGVALVEHTTDEYMAPVAAYIRGSFTTAAVAARHMRGAGGGVIVALSPPMAAQPAPLAGPFGVAGAAVENMCRQLALELAQQRVRVVCLRLTGMPETARSLGSHTGEMWGRAAARLGVPLEEMLDAIGATPVGAPLTVDHVAEVAAFIATDRSEALTGTVVNVTRGAIVD